MPDRSSTPVHPDGVPVDGEGGPAAPGGTRTAPSPPSARRRRGVLVAVGSVLGAALAAPAVHTGLFRPWRWTGPQDFTAHTGAVDWALDPWFLPRLPHFLIHLLALATTRLLGSDDHRVGMWVVTVVLVGAFAGTVTHFLDRAARGVPGGWRAATVLLLMVGLLFSQSPSALFRFGGWALQEPGTFFLPLVVLNGPTALGSYVFSFGLLLGVVGLLTGSPDHGRRWLAPLTVAALLAKPNYAPFLAAVAVTLAWRGRDGAMGPERLRAVVLRLVVPVAVVLPLQWALMQWREPDDTRNSIVVAPFRDLHHIGGFRPLFWLVLVFPAACLLLFRRHLLGPWVAVTGGCLGLQLVAGIVLGMDPLTPAADGVWTIHVGVFFLTIACVARVVELTAAEPSRWRARTALAAVAWLPGVLSGWAIWWCHGGGACLLA